MKNQLPPDCWQQCLWMVRGYDRCHKEYEQRGKELGDDFLPFRQMRAVDQALDLAVDDLPLGQRQSVRAALMQFCQDGRDFDFDMLDELGITKRELFSIRQHCLFEIANELGLIIVHSERK